MLTVGCGTALAQKLEQSLVQLEATKAHVLDLEEQLKVKEAEIADLKKAAFSAQSTHKFQLQVLLMCLVIYCSLAHII